MNRSADASALEQLNGFSDAAGLRNRGRLILPGPLDATITFDLSKPYRSRDELIEEYWRFHPRYLFFKSLPERCRLVDVGAGTGGLVGWKVWGAPFRRDVRMYAVDIEEGAFFKEYIDFDIVEIGKDETKFPDGAFDAILMSHLIELIGNRGAASREMARLARPGATIYIEWPTQESGRIVSRSALAPFGIYCGTLNFFDDSKHVELVSEEQVEQVFTAAGFRRIAAGEIINDYLYPELFRFGVANSDPETTTYALWLAFRFSRYLIMEKADAKT